MNLDDIHGLIRPATGVEAPIHRAAGQQAGQSIYRCIVENRVIASNHHRAVRHQLNVPDGAVGPEADPVRDIHRAGRSIGCLVVHDGDHRPGIIAQRRAAHYVVEADEKILVVLKRPIIGQADDELFTEVTRPELERPDSRFVVGELPGRDRRAIRRQVADRLGAGFAVLANDRYPQLAAVLVDKILSLGQLDDAVRVVVHDGHDRLVGGAKDHANRVGQLRLEQLVQFHVLIVHQRDGDGAVADVAVLP